VQTTDSSRAADSRAAEHRDSREQTQQTNLRDRPRQREKDCVLREFDDE
jgi:hypothetical protein